MTVTVEKLERVGGSGEQLGRLFDPGGEHSLDDLVVTAWGSLGLRGSARCLVCGAIAVRHAGAGESVAECGSCGSRLD